MGRLMLVLPAILFIAVGNVVHGGHQAKIWKKIFGSYKTQVTYTYKKTHTYTHTHHVSQQVYYRYHVDVKTLQKNEHIVNVRGDTSVHSSVVSGVESAVVHGKASGHKSCKVSVTTANVDIQGCKASNPVKITFEMCGYQTVFVIFDGYRYYTSLTRKWKDLGCGESGYFTIHGEKVQVHNDKHHRTWTLKACGITINFRRDVTADQPHPVDLFGKGVQEWNLAFRGTALIRQSVYKAYMHGSDNVESGCKQTSDPSLPCFSHYRSSILDNWKYIDEVAFVIYNAGVMKKYAIFNGRGTDNLSWFCASRLKSSSWCSLRGNQQYFSIFGDGKLQRRFFINHNYGGCKNDAGWFVAVDRSCVDCQWEKGQGFPMFLYSTTGRFENWTHGKYAQADVIAVYVKYAKIEELPAVDLFNNDKPEWRLVFRGTSRINQPVYDAYLHGRSNVEAACKQTNGNIPCSSHYRSCILDYWTDIDEVAVVLFKSGNMKKYLRFNAKGSNNKNWFDSKRLISSSWSDLKGKQLYFSIAGDVGLKRRFFINRCYGGCENDQGWLVALDQMKRPCRWESGRAYPLFLYANSCSSQNWTHGQVAEADVMAIFVKFKSH